MITTAFVFALCFFGCAVFLFIKLPGKIQKFLTKHQLLTDAGATGGTFLTLSSISASAVAAMASAMVGVMFSAYLWFKKQKMDAQENIQDGTRRES